MKRYSVDTVGELFEDEKGDLVLYSDFIADKKDTAVLMAQILIELAIKHAKQLKEALQ